MAVNAWVVCLVLIIYLCHDIAGISLMWLKTTITVEKSWRNYILTGQFIESL